MLVPLWLAGLVLLDLAALTYVAQRGPWAFGPGSAVLLALAFSQISLATIWAGTARRRVWLKFLSVPATMAAWLVVFIQVGPGDAMTILWLFGVQFLGVIFPLLVARLLGVRLAIPETVAGSSRPLQFSIGHLMLLTAAVAGVVAIGRNLDVPNMGSEREILLAPAFSLIALLAVWAALGTGRILFRLLLLLMLAPAIGVGMAQLLMPATDQLFAFALLNGLQAVLLAGSLWIFRLGGYRLLRRPRR